MIRDSFVVFFCANRDMENGWKNKWFVVEGNIRIYMFIIMMIIGRVHVRVGRMQEDRDGDNNDQ